jgi:very-long-chain enoyl-CoA reductase
VATDGKPGPLPRVHNVLSYSVALVVFPVVVLVRGGIVDAAIVPPLALWAVHFARRTIESALVHKYAKPSVPMADALQEYLYYWGFAAWLGWSVTRAGYACAEGTALMAGVALFAVGELGNLAAHVMLARLRPGRSSARRIPRGFLFELVSSPNYLFEIVTWVGYALVARTAAAWVFLAAGSFVLTDWSRKRHDAYVKEFDGRDGRQQYPARRKRLIPFVF